jgi:asparagine synthase (glutamine-hydrolysing)
VQLVRRICDLQTHRGPDDSGVDAIDNVCLGSNRLKILDLSAAGHMPMRDPETGWWIAFNGEIYNFMEIRKELEALGHGFRSRTDTEVILRGFQQWGEDCLERFRGMFAFAIYDPGTRTVRLVRDRYGKKPLYYTEQQGHILFASELHAMMPVCSGLRPNQQRLIEWSMYRNVDFGSGATLVEGCHVVPAGHVVTIRDGRIVSARAYYTPESHVDEARYRELAQMPEIALIDELDAMLKASIADRLVSDVPVGTLCSGGIDSSLITALCAQTVGSELAAFNVAVEGYPDLDENRYARRVADDLGIKLHTYAMTGRDFRRTLPRAICHADAPLTHPNSIAFLLISEFARKHDVIVLQSGEAADELFGGYFHRYRRIGETERARRLLAKCPSSLRNLLALLGYASEGVPLAAWSAYKGLLAHSSTFIDGFAREDLRLRCEEAYAFIGDATERAVMGSMLADLSDFLAPLLRRLDRMSMAASIECRVPFLDHRLVHTAINLPLSCKLRGRTDKWVLKQIAGRYLPSAIVNRTKRGFPLPFEDYIGPLADPALFENGFCMNVLELNRRGLVGAITGWRANVQGFFNLLAIEVWGRMLFLNESVDELTERCTSTARG